MHACNKCKYVERTHAVLSSSRGQLRASTNQQNLNSLSPHGSSCQHVNMYFHVQVVLAQCSEKGQPEDAHLQNCQQLARFSAVCHDATAPMASLACCLTCIHFQGARPPKFSPW
ncbi:hypothetical protein H0G86_010958 [Trichoderma simmonsii]|uniref:Uncharacterized protein n=1 Tax=Trichoderma simmonsii TaxID=1491479 RepID=A0A8G0LQU2_9HYPO|nr:hypothetical protein H0G86_010958 [Trichoderma simmonsii]